MYRILTHPIYSNFGGILQAFALQRAVRQLGQECSTIDYLPIIDCERYSNASFFKRLKFKWALQRLKWGIGRVRFPWYLFPQIADAFKARFMQMCPLDNKRENLPSFADGTPFIVGSDQVWRCVYARRMQSVPFFFLDFATQDQRRRSIAYAASFASDEWEGTPEETAECARLLREFKAVSVREHSGVQICRDAFGVEAVQMPDPTLLLDAGEYESVIADWQTSSLPEPSIVAYILDENAQHEQLIQGVARKASLRIQMLPQPKTALKVANQLPLSVPQWLRYVRDGEYVVTDSFHGCVFAIIFNKPFVCLGNEMRGTARFDSLLGTFNLQDRLLMNPTPERALEVLRRPIDWAEVNTLREAEKMRGLDFLAQNLEKE